MAENTGDHSTNDGDGMAVRWFCCANLCSARCHYSNLRICRYFEEVQPQQSSGACLVGEHRKSPHGHHDLDSNRSSSPRQEKLLDTHQTEYVILIGKILGDELGSACDILLQQGVPSFAVWQEVNSASAEWRVAFVCSCLLGPSSAGDLPA